MEGLLEEGTGPRLVEEDGMLLIDAEGFSMTDDELRELRMVARTHPVSELI